MQKEQRANVVFPSSEKVKVFVREDGERGVKDITVIVKAAREPSFQASCTGAAREPFIPSIVYGGSKRTFHSKHRVRGTGAAREPSFQASCTGAAREPFIPSIVYGGSKRTFHSKHRVRGQQENLSFQASCTGAAREPFIPSIVYGDTMPAGQARFHGFVSRH